VESVRTELPEDHRSFLFSLCTTGFGSTCLVMELLADILPDTLATWFQQYRPLLGWVGLGSFGLLVGSLLMSAWLLTRLPADYFVREDGGSSPNHPLLRPLVGVIRNVVGAVLIIAGLAMLVLPGQGLLTILVGLVLVHVPGKRRLLRRILRQETVRETVDQLRRQAGREPLILEEPEPEDASPPEPSS